MYIRIKRHKTTYFIQCDPTESTLSIKQKLQALIDQPSNSQRLTLVSTNEILDDSKTLAEQKVENDAIVALTFKKGSFFSLSSFPVLSSEDLFFYYVIDFLCLIALVSAQSCLFPFCKYSLTDYFFNL
ncbi:hypothetical protein KSP40_PGU007673 [Platanthera guangdongensis]|uniref:Ubiquitin-like domain-containing protein n=1 Tax=Platanthera guangdongensis TaxID=2320717 RepID=A0ABR2MFM2_9ASPA